MFRKCFAVAAVVAAMAMGAEARAQSVAASGTAYNVNANGVASAVAGSWTAWSTGTVRIISGNHMVDIYLGAGSVNGTNLVTTFVLRDRQTTAPLYGGECQVPLAGATSSAVDVYLRSTRQYIGDPIGGYKTFNINPTPWNRYRLVSP